MYIKSEVGFSHLYDTNGAFAGSRRQSRAGAPDARRGCQSARGGSRVCVRLLPTCSALPSRQGTNPEGSEREPSGSMSSQRFGSCPVRGRILWSFPRFFFFFFLHQSFLIWCKNKTRSRNDRTTVMLLVATEIHQNCPSLSYQL